MIIVSESGLYSLAFKSRKPEAKLFQKWVTNEVLPAIRKTGGYLVSTEQDTPETILARAVILAQETISKQEKILAEKNQKLLEQAPKVEYFDTVLNTDSEITSTTLAKELNMSTIDFNKWLIENDVIFKQGDIYHLKAQYCNKDYSKYRTFVRQYKNVEITNHNLVWTERGRQFIRSLFQLTKLQKNLF